MIRMVPACIAMGLLAGCATTEPGWTGTDATPFGEAEAACTASTASDEDAVQRDRAFVDCMAGKGWTRSEPQ